MPAITVRDQSTGKWVTIQEDGARPEITLRDELTGGWVTFPARDGSEGGGGELPNSGRTAANYEAMDGQEAPPFPNFNWSAATYHFEGQTYAFDFTFPDSSPEAISNMLNDASFEAGAGDKLTSEIVPGQNGGRVIRVKSTEPVTVTRVSGEQDPILVGTFDQEGFPFDSRDKYILVEAENKRLSDVIADLTARIEALEAGGGAQPQALTTSSNESLD